MGSWRGTASGLALTSISRGGGPSRTSPPQDASTRATRTTTRRRNLATTHPLADQLAELIHRHGVAVAVVVSGDGVEVVKAQPVLHPPFYLEFHGHGGQGGIERRHRGEPIPLVLGQGGGGFFQLV